MKKIGDMRRVCWECASVYTIKSGHVCECGEILCPKCHSPAHYEDPSAEQDSTGEAQITQWACGGCGATVNGRQNYCPECGGTLTKGDKDCNGHCNCQQRGQ